MRKSMFLLIFVVTLFAFTADQSWGGEAEKIIKRYLKMPRPDKYSEIIGLLENTELSFKNPDPAQTRSYIRMVVSTAEQALADTGGKSKTVWDATGRFDRTRKGYSVDKQRVVVDLD
ncbi:MAG: hypothetical protein GWN67_09315, partial [Phycisphaerae bacterium]|nr:hypothetical protein [Phycisphaerae bacterium]NIP52301.1 hypothetical protein [Phycisphaerae bacterium]NIS51264.1 hypothetical protein [Phycisphaerae bacterium]NIU09776.1 hypothetical protein [Phycisphaerae bacterium]NIU56564.1 hypothetical protein [Phycisphaerae bacterium]